MSSPGNDLFEFGDFRIEAAGAPVLTRGGQPVALKPKVVETLLVLVRNSGRVVPKEQLMQALWPGTAVEESNLTQNIYLLRKALGEAPDGRPYIETLPKRGYRFTPRVKALGGAAEQLLVVEQSETLLVTIDEEVDVGGATPGGSCAVARGVYADGPRADSPRAGSADRRRLYVAAAACSLAILFAAASGVRSYFIRDGGVRARSAQPAPAPPARPVELRRLTHDGRTFHPAVSPDGRRLAYNLLTDAGSGPAQSLRLLDVDTGSSVEVMPPALPGYADPAFSPDGRLIYFTTADRSGAGGGSGLGVLARAPIFGGPPHTVAREVSSGFGLSQDGRSVAFLRSRDGLRRQTLFVAATEGGGERGLASNPPGARFNVWGASPSWSDDGLSLAVCGGREEGERPRGLLFEVGVGDGGVREVRTPDWAVVDQAVWLPGKTALVVLARERASWPSQVWLVPYPAGEARRVTNDLSDYGRISLTADGGSLVAQQTARVSHVWLLPGADSSRARQLTGGMSADGHSGLDWAPDGRFVFVSNRSGDSCVWRVEADGANPTRLTGGGVAAGLSLSPDGRWVYYSVRSQDAPGTIHRVAVEGGEPERVSGPGFTAGSPSVSPDGRLIAYVHHDEERGWCTGVMPAEGGEPLNLFGHAAQGVIRWTPDSRALVYIKPESGNLPGANLWRQPLDGRPPAPLTNFGPEEDPITNFAISPDGRRLLVARGRLNSDAVLITNFR